MRDFKQEVFDILDVILSANDVKLTMVDADSVDLGSKEVSQILGHKEELLEHKMVFSMEAPIAFADGIKELIDQFEIKGDVEIGIEDIRIIEIPKPKEAQTLIALRGNFGINIVIKVKV